MFGCAPKLGLSITPTSNEIIHVLLNEEDLQAHVNDKPSDNTLHNANSIIILYANAFDGLLSSDDNGNDEEIRIGKPRPERVLIFPDC
jgi:hypothetical protein